MARRCGWGCKAKNRFTGPRSPRQLSCAGWGRWEAGCCRRHSPLRTSTWTCLLEGPLPPVWPGAWPAVGRPDAWPAGDGRAAPGAGPKCGAVAGDSWSCFQPGRARVAPGGGRGPAPGADRRGQLPAPSPSSGAAPGHSHVQVPVPCPGAPASQRCPGSHERWRCSGECPARSEDLQTFLPFTKSAASGFLEPCEAPSPRL